MVITIPPKRTKYYVFFRLKGRQVSRSCGTAVYAEATVRAAEIFAEEVTGKPKSTRSVNPEEQQNLQPSDHSDSSPPLPADKTIEEVIQLYDSWIASATPGQKRPTPSTVRLYKNRLRQLCRMLGVTTVGQLRGGMNGLTAEKIGTSADNFIPLLRNASGPFRVATMEFYRKKGAVFENPFPTLPAVKKWPRFVPPVTGVFEKLKEDAEKELKPNHERMWLLYLLTLGVGLRVQEATHAMWEDVLPTGVWARNDYIHRTKSDKDRFVEVSPRLLQHLEALRRQPNDWVVPDGDGPGRKVDIIPKQRGIRASRHLSKWIRTKFKERNLPNPTHFLRKVFGSIVAKEHGLLTASRFLGHSSISVTEKIYVGLIPGAVANAI